jgi:hypothetical protein
MFKYYNMDRAIESGIDTAEELISRQLQEGRRETVTVGA